MLLSCFPELKTAPKTNNNKETTNKQTNKTQNKTKQKTKQNITKHKQNKKRNKNKKQKQTNKQKKNKPQRFIHLTPFVHVGRGKVVRNPRYYAFHYTVNCSLVNRIHL